MNPWNIKIVADSSSDVLELASVPFVSAPLKIIASGKEYVDDSNLNVAKMSQELLQTTEKSSTACPSVGDWLEAFGDAPYIFCVTITSNLSGSYNSATIAKESYEEAHPDRKVFVIDSLSAGPELRLIIEKLEELILAEKPFDEICGGITEYQKHTRLLFMLESMRNLANNGRVSRLAASAAGVLGIRAIGKASDEGRLEMLSKHRGERKALTAIVQHMEEIGHRCGKVRISHCLNESAAQKLKELIQKRFAESKIEIHPSRGLCTFYAEMGGLLIGFEI